MKFGKLFARLWLTALGGTILYGVFDTFIHEPPFAVFVFTAVIGIIITAWAMDTLCK